MNRTWRFALLPVLLGLLWFQMPSAQAAYSRAPAAGWYPRNGVAYAMAEVGQAVYIGGGFTKIRSSATGQTVTRNRLAAFDARTGALLAWNPGADGVVRALDVGADGTVYAGGEFLHVGGVSATRIAAITPSGAAVAGWRGTANNTVRAVVASARGVYIAGNFAKVDGASQNSLALLNARTGSRLTGFNGHVGHGKVRSMSLDGGTLYLGGSFRRLGGSSRSYAGAVDAVTGHAEAWAPTALCDGCQVLGMATDAARVYAAVGGPGGGRAVSWAKSDASRVWQRHADGDCQAIAAADGLVYVGGHFGPNFASATRHQLVVLDAARGGFQTYALPFTGNDHPGLWALSVGSQQLRIGGGFALAGSSIRRYAVFPTVG